MKKLTGDALRKRARIKKMEERKGEGGRQGKKVMIVKMEKETRSKKRGKKKNYGRDGE